MASPAPDAEVAASTASAIPPVTVSSTPTNEDMSLEVEPEIGASKASDGPAELTYAILRQVIGERGDRTGRISPDVLAASPYNMTVSDEEVRRRVKKLLDEESATKGEHACLDNIMEMMEQVEKKNPTSTSGYQEKDEEAVARDLDMLADTVRSFVADAVGSAAAVDNGAKAASVNEAGDEENSIALAEISNGADVNVEVATEESSEAVVSSELDGSNAGTGSSEHDLGESNATLAGSPEVAREVVQEVAKDEAYTVEHTSSAVLDGGDGDVAALKRPAVEAGKSSHMPKRQKRAEYSEETRALCVRRHQTEGVSYATISKELGIPHDSVRAIVRKAKRTGSVSSAPRSGRPRKTSGIVDKVILEAVRANKQCSAKSIQQDLLRLFGVKVSPETVRRRVLEHTKQRIQAISGGTSDTPTEPGNEVAADSSATIVGASTGIDTSLSDSLSFQQMLHEENQFTREDKALGCPGPTTSPASEDSQAVPRVPSPAPANDTADMNSEAMREPSSQKRPKRGEYSIETREQCVALHDQGQGYRRIGKALSMPHTTVRAIVEKAQRTGSVLPAKRSGRPRKTDEIVDKVILQAVQANEKSSARMIKEQLLEAYGVRVSCETIRRRVKEHSRQSMSATLSNSEVDATLAQQQAAHEQEMLVVTGPPPMAAASLITFDENGVHL